MLVDRDYEDELKGKCDEKERERESLRSQAKERSEKPWRIKETRRKKRKDKEAFVCRN